MKLYYIKEPLLEFGQGSHVCPRTGITNYDVYDTKLKIRRERVLVGAVGTSDTLSKLYSWLEKCSQPIPAPQNSKQPNLRVPFCGFKTDLGFKSSLVIDEEITRTLNHSSINEVIHIRDWNERVDAAVDLYYRQAKFLAQNRVVDVIACVIPTRLYDQISKPEVAPVNETLENEEEQADDALEVNFRRALKARAMHLGKPLQIIREVSLESNAKGQQDDATKAWNLCTALYYKTNQTVPWKLITNINRPSVCFVGISFYQSRDRKVLNTSLAQIFDELGNNVILRGTPVDIDKNDRRPHLKAAQAYQLLKRALTEYDIALDTSPARLVLHKSSKYSDEELDGFESAAREMRVRKIDFVTILDSDFRLFRGNEYPSYRGIHVEFDEENHLLYTRGSVEYYKTYTGKYIPQPLEIRIVRSDESPGIICQEILGLTKMNWNNTQFDGKYPITLACSRKVGQVMKYLGPDDDDPQISYSFYM
ncbi:hypothetical protein PQG02_33275 (plasmid) [Nostoc sp. UHCC 0926]|uniref:argonaute/piwi family protein n=1 Tax=Nostoc sp. UHCC 0926 TaxID=3025190 RepID=UPI0023616180|nr:hypothetical protein [Nostoc sp. UHCC 0926]WDD36292.1 hypothetical protein PQG02_33275 [Nostoc sp. UHCC 0926]